MNVDFFVWRPVGKGLATLTEIRTSWTLCDLLDAHEFLDIQEEADAHAMRQK